MTTGRTRCTATTARGRACQIFADASGKCPLHRMSPEQRVEAGARGALSQANSGVVVDLRNARAIERTLAAVATAVAAGQMAASQAKVVFDSIRIVRKVREDRELSRRVEELERRQ